MTPVNDPPAVQNDRYFVDAGLTLDGASVLDNDCDSHLQAPGEGVGQVRAELLTGPAHGDLLLRPDGTFVCTPRGDFVGEDHFVYQLVDEDGVTSRPAGVSVVVMPSESDPLYVASKTSTHWSYDRPDVPDFDQFRAEFLLPDSGAIEGLPADGGMYCVPTSAVNWMAYIATHGFPSMQPGDREWFPGGDPAEHAEEYDLVTEALAEMGELMGAHPQGGTGWFGVTQGMTRWLGESGMDRYFTFTTHDAYSGQAVLLRDLVDTAIGGGLVFFGIGFYQSTGDLVDELPQLEGQPEDTLWRRGGHVTSLVGAEQTVFVLEDGHLTALDRAGQVQHQAALANGGVGAIAYDDGSNRLAAYSSTSNQLFCYDDSLQLRETVAVDPSLVTGDAGAARTWASTRSRARSGCTVRGRRV